MYIGISGWPGCGKDTLASMFEKKSDHPKFKFVRASLGDQLRKITSTATGLSMSELRNHPQKDQPRKEWFDWTPREITIQVGNQIESLLGKNIWCKMLDKEIEEMAEMFHLSSLEKQDYSFVVPDIRTEIQAQWLKDKKDSYLVRIKSNEKPPKYEIENLLNNYSDWDYIIDKQEWFKDKDKVFKVLCSHLKI